nr:transmembrane protein 205 isoform X2 [Anas platyrhynchos]
METPGPNQGPTLTTTEPSNTVKLLHLLLLSASWGMQIWVTLVAGLVMRSRLPRHTSGLVQRELSPYYFHIGSTCAFLNLTLFAMHHPSELLSEEETTQIIIFFVCVAVSALNTQWLGQASCDIAAEMHRIERAHGLGQEVGLLAGGACRELRASDPRLQGSWPGSSASTAPPPPSATSAASPATAPASTAWPPTSPPCEHRCKVTLGFGVSPSPEVPELCLCTAQRFGNN